MEKKKSSKGSGRPQAFTELQKEIMFHDYAMGKTLKDVSVLHGVTYDTLLTHAKRDGWKSRKEKVIAEQGRSRSAPQEIVRDETIDKTLRMIHKVVTDTERRLFAGDSDALKGNLKVIVDCMEKLIKLQMHVDSGGVSKSEVHMKKETVDWNKLIEMSVKAKKEHGDGFNEKEFLRDVLDAEVKK